MAGPKVLAVLVAHASRTRVAEALRSLAVQTYRDLEIVVAAVGSLTIPEDTGARARVVEVDEGAGFAEAVDRVLAAIETDDTSYLLLLHDDVSLQPDVVEHLVRTASSDREIAAVGAKLVEWDQPHVLQEVGAAIDRFAIRRSSLDAGEVDAGQRDDTSDVLFCSDACLLVRRDAFEEIGGLDEKAWPFYEDVDLCWRFRARGARVIVDPTAVVRHAADLSKGRRLFDTLELREHAEQGRLRFMLKHYAPLGLAVLLPQVLLASLARLVAAVVRRELWRTRIIFGAWGRILRELPGIYRERRRSGAARVEDRDLLQLAARGAVGDVRGERAEWASRLFGTLGRIGDRALELARQPVTWASVLAALVVIALLRSILLGGTFALGELRAIAPFGDALADHLGRVQREGLDPFGPSAPGQVVLGLLRSILHAAPLAEKVVLLLPVAFAGLAGGRLARALGFTGDARRWIAPLAAINPVTLVLLRDGSVGALLTWAASLWLVSALISPAPRGEGSTALLRFVGRWSIGWAVVVALHPPALVWLLALGTVVVAARRDDNRGAERLRILLAGSAGAFVLLLPWSAGWFSQRSPLVGRPGWLVHTAAGGLDLAGLGASWPFLGLLVLALAAAFFVRLTKTTFALASLAGAAILAAAGGVMSRETMLAGAGSCALVVVVMVARRISDDLPSYEFGTRHAAVIGGIVTIAIVWFGGVVHTVPGGARARTIPVIAGVRESETGRVLWLAQTTGGLRAWTTLSFSEQLGAFPPPAGPEERLVTRAIESARAGRTHRLGGILALGDISHIVALDAAAANGLSSQADIALQETQSPATIYRNDGWRGSAILLSAPPGDALHSGGLADVVQDPRALDVSGWPYGPITVHMPDDASTIGRVLYLTSGRRGGIHIDHVHGTTAAAGVYVPADDLHGSVRVSLPGRWWRWMLPIEALLVVTLLGAWLVAAYAGGPLPVPPPLLPETAQPGAGAASLVLAPLLVLLGVGVSWSGVSWGVSTPFLSSAWYCPPVGAGYQQGLAIANPNRDTVRYVVRPNLAGAPTSAGRISGYSRVTIPIDATKGAVVESYRRRLVVADAVARQGAGDASLCSAETPALNIFPEGGRGATRAIPRLFERYVLYNPFPDVARAAVRFVSPKETISPPRLQDVHVPPGSAVEVNPEDEFEPMLDLSTTVRVWQGRAIVARRLRTVDQVSWSLPVAESLGGIVPRAVTQGAVTELIGVNMSQDPAHVSIAGAGAAGSLPAAHFDIDSVGRSSFDLATLANHAKDLVVRATSDRPVAIESLVAPDDRKAVSLMPFEKPGTHWVFPLAENRTLLLTNATPGRVRVKIRRLGPGDPIASLTIPSNGTASIDLLGVEPFGLDVQASGGGVTAAVIGVFGTMPGVPI